MSGSNHEFVASGRIEALGELEVFPAGAQGADDEVLAIASSLALPPAHAELATGEAPPIGYVCQAPANL